MKIIKGNLILKKDTTFNESIKVEGDIKGNFNLVVLGDIYARDIYARDIYARDIYARDIYAGNINAVDIDAVDIDAENIICEKRTKKYKDSITRARIFIQNRSKLERKEW